jgi:phosphoribosylformimino-5-aminoimidazole carboxamide ribotide isomerase
MSQPTIAVVEWIMQLIPVIDLARGVAVRARAGDRASYEPLESVLTPGRRGDALALVQAYREAMGARECYVADLDAIQGGPVQRSVLRELATVETGFAGSLLVDAGTHRPGGGLEVLSCGASEIVVGLESLHRFGDLMDIVELIGPSRVIFSLDLRLGSPVLHPAMRDASGAADALSLASQAVDGGIRTLLVLDIGRVGTGCGMDVGLLDVLRRRFSGLRLLAGGGVLTRRDLDRVRDVGCDGVLVASAIHAGRIGAGDVAALAGPMPRPRAPVAQSETSDSR